MHTRQTTRADLGYTAEIMREAFVDDYAFAFRFPRRREHPEAWRAMTVQRHRSIFILPGVEGIVAVADGDEQGALAGVPAGTILGYTWWLRMPGRGSSAPSPGLAARVETFLLGIEAAYERWIVPNAAMDPQQMKRFQEIDEVATGPRDYHRSGIEHWHLAAFAVLPKYQGCGVGSMLLQWGQRRAEQQDGPKRLITLNSSPVGIKVYEKAGFRVLGDAQGLFSTMLPGYTEIDMAMAWDPEGRYTRECSAEEERAVGRPHRIWTSS